MGVAAGVAAVGAAGAIGGAVMQSNNLGSASKAQQASDNAAIQQQQAQLAQEQANEAPYLETGSGALAQLSKLYGISTPGGDPSSASSTGYSANQGTPGGTYTNAAGGASTVNPDASFYLSPDFNFTLQQGLNGLTAQGAATNGTQNGAQQKAEIAYAGNLAAGQYSNYVNSLQALAGLGANASSNLNSTSSNTANSISSTQQTQGSNAASSYLGQGTIDAGLLSNLTAPATKTASAGPLNQLATSIGNAL